MPEEVVEAQPETKEPEIVVEVAEETERPGKPQLSDEEVEKLDSPGDEVGQYAKDAQKRIKNLLLANQEWRRRSVQSQKDAATATDLANRLYQENVNLKGNVQRSEGALIDQALQRTEAQLQSAKARMFTAVQAQDTAAIVAANEEMARCVAEAHNLRLLKPATPEGGKDREPPPPPEQQSSPAVDAWVDRNPWFKQNPEMHAYALSVHHSLNAQGITEQNGTAYFGAIDKEMRLRYPEQFGMKVKEPESKELPPTKETPKETGARPVTVTGTTRVNGAAAARTPRHVTLTESELRIANTLGITPEAYAKEKLKHEEATRGTIQ